jgi:valacyclovir hydrolase
MPWHGPDGARIYYEEAGRGEAVVLLPGWGGSIAELSPLRSAIADGFRVIALDLPGSGRSQPQPREYPVTYYHDDATALLDVLDALGVGPAHLAGFSDGGEEALLLAQRRPGLALSIFTWGAAGRIPEPAPGEFEALATAADEPDGEPAADGEFAGLASYLAAAYGVEGARIMLRSWAQAMAGIVAAGGDISWAGAGTIRCPAFLCTGSEDRHCPPELVRELAARIPRGEFREVVGAGHDVHRSRARWLTGQLTSWLAEH